MEHKGINTLLNRRTIRKYSEKKIEKQTLDTILQAGVRASNCGNMQIYSIIVTQNQENKEALCKLHFNQPMVKEASVVLTVCADVNRFHKYCEQRNAPKSYDNFLWLNVSTIDASVCTQAMVSAAEELGIGACYIGTVNYQAKEITELLHLPKGVVPVTTITLGYPAENPPLTERLPLEAVVHYEEYEYYNEEKIEQLYEEFEQLPQIKKYIAESKQENLAQVFTNVRYTKKDAQYFSQKYKDFLKEQEMI